MDSHVQFWATVYAEVFFCSSLSGAESSPTLSGEP
jgi:hypothetical protein